MFYKVLKENTIVDLLQYIRYVHYQDKHGIILLCSPEDAQAVLSSNGKRGWHTAELYSFKPDNSVYQIEEIDKYEYDSLQKSLRLEV